jgi:phosphoglycerate dehydrogenase-like enzyme
MITATNKILFAFGQRDKECFWPGYTLQSMFGDACETIEAYPTSTAELQELLLAHQPRVLVTGWDTPVLPIDAEVSYVCHLAGSVKPLVPRKLLEKGLIVTNWGSVISPLVAEHAILLVLGALRSVALWSSYIDAWHNETSQPPIALQTRSLKGRRIGIHGFGAIAREIVARLKPFGVTISSYSAGVPSELFRSHNVAECSTLEDLFSTSDVLIECEALTPESRGSVNAFVLSLLPHDAVFVNVGRGLVVDETALHAAVVEGCIRVALDVFQEEPLRKDSVWIDEPSALCSPHIAGPTNDSWDVCREICLKNIERYLSGRVESLEGVVTLDIYDRAT